MKYQTSVVLWFPSLSTQLVLFRHFVFTHFCDYETLFMLMNFLVWRQSVKASINSEF